MHRIKHWQVDSVADEKRLSHSDFWDSRFIRAFELLHILGVIVLPQRVPYRNQRSDGDSNNNRDLPV